MSNERVKIEDPDEVQILSVKEEPLDVVLEDNPVGLKASSASKRALEEPDEKPAKKTKLQLAGVVLRPSVEGRFLPSRSSPADTESEYEDTKPLKVSDTSLFLEENDFERYSQDFDIKVKVKKEDLLVDEKICLGRIEKIGCPLFDVTLKEPLQQKCFSRLFISSVYGGNMQSTFPSIDTKKFKHGRKNWMFWNLDRHPQAPKIPGQPGLWFDSLPFDSSFEDDTTFHGFARKKAGIWQYLGEYQLYAAEALTQTEWLLESPKFQWSWARTLQEKDWGRRARTMVYLRHQLGREPTDEELVDVLTGDNDVKNDVTAEQIKNAYDEGKQVGILVLKCVGYDNSLQKELIAKRANWVPPPSSKSVAKGKRKGKQIQVKAKPKGKKPNSKTSQRKDLEEEEEVERDEDGDMAFEAEYIPSGTRSRPIPI